jgi:hypothetical protein
MRISPLFNCIFKLKRLLCPSNILAVVRTHGLSPLRILFPHTRADANPRTSPPARAPRRRISTTAMAPPWRSSPPAWMWPRRPPRGWPLRPAAGQPARHGRRCCRPASKPGTAAGQPASCSSLEPGAPSWILGRTRTVCAYDCAKILEVGVFRG